MSEVHSARLGADSATPAAVKTFRAPAGFDAAGRTRAAVAGFLESAWDQQQAAQQTDAGWAPVHDFGQQDGTGYLVTDAYAASLDDLVAPGRHIAARLLRDVVLRVVAGLASAERLLGRAHGNLKPSNVLVDFESDDASAVRRLGLCDPAPGSTLGRRTSSHRDRQGLGRLIVSLVTGVPSAEAGAWPVPAGPEWNRLGSVGEGWRTLAGDLLNPDQAEHPIAWNEVHRRADLLVAPVEKKPKWPWAVAAAVLLVAAGLTTYVLFPRNTTPPATFDELVQLARESRNWAGTAQGQLTDTDSRYQDILAFVEANPDAAQALDGRLYGETFYPMQPSALLEQDNRFYRQLLSAVDQHAANPTPDAQQTIDDTVAFLESNRTAARRAKAALDAVLAAREALEAYIQQLAADFADPPTRNAESDRLMERYTAYATGAFDDEEREALRAIMQLQEAGGLLQQVESARRSAQERAAFDDPFIAALQQELEAGLADITRVSDAGPPSHEALIDLGERAVRIEQLVRTVTDADRVHYARFKTLQRERYAAADPASVLPDWEAAVLQPGPAHVPQDAPDPRPALNASARLDEMQELIADLLNDLGDDENAEVRQQDLNTLTQTLRSLEDTYAWTNGEREQVEAASAQAAAQLDALKDRIGIDIENATREMAVEIPLLQRVTLKDMAAPGEDSAHYFDVLENHEFSASPALVRAWGRLRDRIIADVQRNDSKPIVLQKNVQEAVLSLREIDRRLRVDLLDTMLDADTTVARWSRGDTLTRFDQRREDAIDRLVPGLDDALASGAGGSFREGSGVVPGLDAEQGRLNGWAEQASAVLQSYHALNTYFARYHAPDDRVDREPAGSGQAELSTLLQEAQQRAGDAELSQDLSATDRQFDLVVDLYAEPAELNTRRDAILSAIDAQPGDDLAQALQQAADDPEQDAAVRVGAALAALSLDTPTDVAQLTQRVALRGGYEELVTAQEAALGGERVKAILDRFDGRASVAWQQSLNRATDAQEAEALLALTSATPALPPREDIDPAAPMLGVAENLLSSISRANLYLDRYQARVAALDREAIENQAQDDRAETLAQELRDHLTPYRDDARVARLCDRLDSAIEQKRAGGTQRPENAGLGPEVDWLGGLGITVSQIDPDTGAVVETDTGELAARRVYRFELGDNGEAVDVAFRLVEPAEHGDLAPDAPPAYLSTSEVPVGFFIDVLNTTRSQPDFTLVANLTSLRRCRSPLWEVVENAAQTITGIARFDWELEDRNFPRSLRAPWVARQTESGAFRAIASAEGVNEPVSADHPMQAINISGAAYFAQLLGCRLPKLVEWQAAVEDSGGLDACLREANVRDASWLVQQEYLAGLTLSPIEMAWTSAQSFTAQNVFDQPAPQERSAVVGNNDPADYDDGFVWPRAVDPDAAEYQDLVGNVAEWVVNDAGDLDAGGMLLPAERPVAEGFGVRQEPQWMDRNFLIIGGSAMSCSQTCPHDLPVLVSARYNRGVKPSPGIRYSGYSDVGFRLAFTVGQPRLMVTLTSLLRDDFLPPVAPQ
ncbi:hypothetical protein OT109_15555 [Phycisphaeraceae bacterium D3-23]